MRKQVIWVSGSEQLAARILLVFLRGRESGSVVEEVMTSYFALNGSIARKKELSSHAKPPDTFSP